jgi:hypothetical protein
MEWKRLVGGLYVSGPWSIQRRFKIYGSPEWELWHKRRKLPMCYRFLRDAKIAVDELVAADISVDELLAVARQGGGPR